MPERRSNLDFSGGQTGDVTSGDSAGRDIYHGLDPALLRYLEGERQSRDAFAAALERLWARLDTMERDARTAEQDAAMERAIDFEARLKRQASLDARLDGLDRRFVWMAAVVFVALIVALGLLYREFALLAARAAFDVLALSR